MIRLSIGLLRHHPHKYSGQLHSSLVCADFCLNICFSYTRVSSENFLLRQSTFMPTAHTRLLAHLEEQRSSEIYNCQFYQPSKIYPLIVCTQFLKYYHSSLCKRLVRKLSLYLNLSCEKTKCTTFLFLSHTNFVYVLQSVSWFKFTIKLKMYFIDIIINMMI